MGFVQLENADKRELSAERPLEGSLDESEPAEFAELYEIHYRPVFGYVLRTVMNRQVAEDITGETFFRAYREFAKFQPRLGSFSTWVFAIATNQMRDHFRKNRGAVVVALADSDLEGLLAHHASVTDRGDELERIEAYRLLHEKVRLLKPIYRIVITLYYFEGRSLRDIAQILGELQPTVRWRLFRARTLLAQKLNRSRGDLR
jgi:RNA polymerase sigma-70 factor (ECF subfamily)